jgi:RecA/RadA recombinase
MDIEKENEQVDDTQEMLDSVKIDKNVELPIKEDEEVTESLHQEFGSFLKNSIDMEEDSGEKSIIPIGIELLDTILGGGLAVGALNMICGQPGSGKSMLAFQALGNAQLIYKGELVSGVLDSEEATTTIRLRNLGVKNPLVKPYNKITVEKVFKFIEGLCLFKEQKKIIDIPSMAIWDSIANTLSSKELEAEDPNTVIGYKARLLSLLIPKYISKCSEYNICFVAVNQLRDDIQIGMFPNAKNLKFLTQGKTLPGGNVLMYNSFHLIEMKVGAVLKKEKYGFDGVVTKVKCVKNKLFPPNIEIELLGTFVNGFSNFWTNFNLLSKEKRLSTGAWNYLVTLPEKKFRTKDAEKLYNEDKRFKEMFDISVQETLKEWREKYGTE